MKPFRFRAQAALQLRRREHDQALSFLGRAETALTVAQRRVAEAHEAIRETEKQLNAAMSMPTAQVQLDWYRSWRLRCTVERDQREQQRRARELDVRKASAIVVATHQRVRSLECLHDHLLAEWKRAADLEERKEMDDLATMRFTRRKDDV